MFKINVKAIQQITVVEVIGDIDGKTAPEVQEKIRLSVAPGGKIILDMSQVAYLSSAGLRVLLAVHRDISGRRGRLVLVGLAEELKELMSMTGFLGQFTVCDTLEAGLEACG